MCQSRLADDDMVFLYFILHTARAHRLGLINIICSVSFWDLTHELPFVKWPCLWPCVMSLFKSILASALGWVSAMRLMLAQRYIISWVLIVGVCWMADLGSFCESGWMMLA